MSVSAEPLHPFGHYIAMASFISKMLHISSSEEILLPGTEESTLEMGFCTQHLHTITCLSFFFFALLSSFFSVQPTSFYPFCPLNGSGGMVSQVTDGMFSGKLWGPRPPLGAQMGDEVQLMLFLFFSDLTMGQRWRNKKNKDQVILQTAWLAGGGLLCHDLGFSSRTTETA